MDMENKYLIGIDLDGTTLMTWDGGFNEETNKRIDKIHPLTKKAIKKLIELGHVVVINSGRNWEESENLYKELGLNSFIVNSAGAHVHNPSDSSYPNKRFGMKASQVNEILNDPIVNNNLAAWSVDNNDLVHLFEDSCEEFKEKAYKYWDVKLFDGKFDFETQSGILFYENKTLDEINEVVLYMREKWGSDIHATNWGTTGGDSGGIEINPAKYNKGSGLIDVANQLGIKHENTMGFGDGENDLELIKQAAHGVAMVHAVDYIKEHAQYITELDNNEGGVGQFLVKFFNLDI